MLTQKARDQQKKKMDTIPFRIVINEILIHIKVCLYSKNEFEYWGYFRRDKFRSIRFVFRSIFSHLYICYNPKLQKTIINIKRVWYLESFIEFLPYILKNGINVNSLHLRVYFSEYKLEELFLNDRFHNLEHLVIGDETDIKKIKSVNFNKLKTLEISEARDVGQFFKNNKLKNLRKFEVKYHQGATNCLFDVFKLPSKILTTIKLTYVFNFNWKIFSTQEVINLKNVYLKDIFWEGLHTNRNTKNPSVVIWNPILNLQTLHVENCNPFSERSLMLQNFKILDKIFIRNKDFDVKVFMKKRHFCVNFIRLESI